MTAQYQSAGTAGTGTTSATPSYPASSGAGDLILAIVGGKPSYNFPSLTNFTRQCSVSNGFLAASNGAGDVRNTAFASFPTSSKSGTETASTTSGSPTMAQMLRFTKGYAETWELETYTGSDTTEDATNVVADIKPWVQADAMPSVTELAFFKYLGGWWIFASNFEYAVYATQDPSSGFTQASITFGPSTILVDMDYDPVNGIFAAMDSDGNIFTATDPSGTWTARATFIFGTGAYGASCLAYGNGLWVAGGGASIVPTHRTTTDPTGSSWSTSSSPLSGTVIFALKYGNGTWVGISDGSTNPIETSTNGTTWTKNTTVASISSGVSSLAYGNGYWYINNSTGLYTTTPAGSWSTPSWSGTTGSVQAWWDGSHWWAIDNYGLLNQSGSAPSSWVAKYQVASDGVSDYLKLAFGNDQTFMLELDTTNGGAVWEKRGEILDIKSGDIVVISATICDDAPTHTSQSLSIPGCTVGTVTWLSKISTTSGSDGGMYIGYASITAGTATGIATYTATSSVSGKSGTAVSLSVIRAIPPANIDTISDDFTVEDDVTWNYNGLSSVSGGVLTVATSSFINTRSYYSLVGLSAYVDWPAATSGSKKFALLAGSGTVANSLHWLLSSTGALTAQYLQSDGQANNVASMTYSSSTRYCRIREASGTVYWDYSADGSTWNNAGSASRATIEASWTSGLSVAGLWVALIASVADQTFEGFNVIGPGGGPQTIEASASFAGSSGLSVTGTSQRFATASFAATSSMTAVGALQISAAVTLAGSSTFSATGAHTAVATVTMTASSTLTLTATKTAIAAASYAAVSTFTAVGVATRFATVAYTAAAGFTATGATLISATVTFASVSGWAFGGAPATLRAGDASGSFVNIATQTDDVVYCAISTTCNLDGSLGDPTFNWITPSGWTQLSTRGDGTAEGGALYRRIATGTSTAAYSTDFVQPNGDDSYGYGITLVGIASATAHGYVAGTGRSTTVTYSTAGQSGDLLVNMIVLSEIWSNTSISTPASESQVAIDSLYLAAVFKIDSQGTPGSHTSTLGLTSRWDSFSIYARGGAGAGAVVEKFGTGTFAGSSSFSATGTPDHKATASFAATSSLTAVGETAGGIVSATASFPTSSAFTATGTVTAIAAVTLAATSAFSATGVVSKIAAATYAATSSFSATGVVTRLITASATMAATSTFTAVSFVFRPASVTFAGSSALTIQAFREISAAITMAASSTLSLTGFVTFFATATFTALADFTALATPYRLGVLKPNILYGMSGLTGTYTDIDDSPDTPDANALVPSGGAIAVRIGFEDHGYQMRLLAGDQILRVVVKVP